jgi:DNA-directed RNA polymerase specialized sigma24 family protein
MEQQQSLFNEQQRANFFIMLYKKVFPKVAQYVSRKGGSLDDAKDIFQESIVAYYEKAVTTNVKLNNEQAYLMGIAKHLWLKKFSANKEQPLDDKLFHDLQEAGEEKPITTKLLLYLETAGQKCMNLLKAFYYDQAPVQEIADLFGYSGVRSATVQKYKCLEKVRDTVKQKSLHYEDFIE